MVKYLLDTNFLMYCVDEKIDFLQELGGKNILVPEEVILELKKLKNEGNFKEKNVASIVLEMVNDIERINLGKGYVDDLIAGYARKNNVIVGTMDKHLQKQIKKNKGRILEIIGRKKIIIE